MTKAKLAAVLLVPILTGGLLVANVANAETGNNPHATSTPNSGLHRPKPKPPKPPKSISLQVVNGTATQTSGDIITVIGMSKKKPVFTIDASGAVIMKNNATSTVSDILVGDKIMAKGKLTGTNLVATSIRDGAVKKKKKDN